MPAASAVEIFRFLLEGMREGHRGLLTTITDLTGTGARAVGTHMAVLDNGDCAGSFSSGCVEAAIIAEAIEVFSESRPRVVRFGQGSPYIDIKLPCGGGIDALFLPDPSTDVLELALECFASRRPFVLTLDPAGALRILPDRSEKEARWREGIFAVGHAPPLRLILLGHGAEMLTTLQLARSFGATVEIYSPDEQVVDAGLEHGIRSTRLISPTSPLMLEGDPWTAFLFLFHDHDWEPPLLARALETESFWVGAMGSPRTQKARRAALKAYGIEEEIIARVRGPIGLIPHTRDPATLGLSAFAEIAGAYRAVTN